MKLDFFPFPHFSSYPLWITLLCVVVGVFGCSPSLYWVHELEGTPSCIPDRLPTWDDYPRQDRYGKKAAITGVNFFPIHTPPKIEMRFDYQRSWVKASLTDPWNPVVVNESKRILLHEQLHFMISCLVTRQANHQLENGGDPLEMVQKVKDRAQRLHLQYDKDTNHGLNTEAQMKWEKEIQQELLRVSTKMASRF